MFVPAIVGAAAGGLSALGGIGATTASLIGLTTMATLSAGLSSYQQGRYNQLVARQEAQQRQTANNLNENLHRKRLNQLLAYQRAATGANGITFSGSPVAVAQDSIYQYELDKSIRQYNADIDSTRLLNQGELSMMQGRSALTNSLLQAPLQAFDTYQRYSK